RCLAVSQIKGPDARKTLIKAQALQRLALLHKGMTPTPEGFGIVGAERQTLLDHEARAPGLGLKGRAARQHAARKDVLLNEIRGGLVTVEQVVADGDGLYAGVAAGLEAGLQHLEVSRPVRLPH